MLQKNKDSGILENKANIYVVRKNISGGKTMNMIIGKRQIILAALILGLSVAIYLNFALSNETELPTATDTVSSSENYGDALFTGTQTVIETGSESANAEFFAQARLTRQKMREESVLTIQTMLSSASIEGTQDETLSQKATVIAQAIEVENKIENLIKAKGFVECIAYISEDSANIIVQTNGLLTSEAAQIKDIVLSETKLTASDVKIVEIKE